MQPKTETLQKNWQKIKSCVQRYFKKIIFLQSRVQLKIKNVKIVKRTHSYWLIVATKTTQAKNLN